MPRTRVSRKRPWSGPHRELDPAAVRGLPHTETGPGGGEYHVQYLAAAAKEYTCPGCLRTIAVGSAHVVVWSVEAPFGQPQGVGSRRHWHPECWRRGLRPT